MVYVVVAPMYKVDAKMLTVLRNLTHPTSQYNLTGLTSNEIPLTIYNMA